VPFNPCTVVIVDTTKCLIFVAKQSRVWSSPSFHLLLNAIFLAQNADAGYQDANCTNHGPGLELVAALLTFSLK